MTIRIDTERLRLRPLAPEDCEAHIQMMLDPAVAATLSPTGGAQSRHDLWRQFASYLGHWDIRGYGWFSVEEKATGAWVGRVGPWMPEGWPGLECGWSIARSHWGQGYAPEAAVGAIKWTFDQFPDLPRIISCIAPANANSQAVAKKIGEQKTAETFELWDMSLDIWAADRAAWLARFG
ncbi:GNAT family N-acetyltransferase [Hyphococcus luteus]|uniref:N-acetyltransferase n=1 Tax=Hyphococcus luteus TaxID=2058213 RepID=A0A2S7K670_9PROT|nr:GNAT family N-acetyltransferase [Marinicaulis flavus]PQA88014.1 N-acetyltransferase [Marinicaulis flavus]